jgi:hypothetical protein
MRSKHWRKLSKEILDDIDVECGICHKRKWSIYKVKTSKNKPGDKRKLLKLQCHHVRYTHMGQRELEKLDILPLCHTDHEILHTIHNLSKKYPVWKIVYELLLKMTSWRYEENVEKEYWVPDDFKFPKPKKEKIKNKSKK